MLAARETGVGKRAVTICYASTRSCGRAISLDLFIILTRQHALIFPQA